MFFRRPFCIEGGCHTDVPPGTEHSFEAVTDCEIIEIYWVTLDANDIDRGDSMGGIHGADYI